ncbi:acyl-CoA dehydrogenase [Trebonia kvetii]|uniref:Acyl-CoA dehydrogenase n=1 Tax=Trebonia kvetii TaxID=2480626 RepID=A0A6P2BT46_9ACTN|nr:acyl-CoA dehydrogenase family protein [Trebonia kvetii]TVZ02214.1 acyl-CoA dehydrogenase [Trebonia kvetii]
MTTTGLTMDPELAEVAERVFAAATAEPAGTESGDTFTRSWDLAAAAGLPWVSVPESAGGPGGTLLDAVTVAYAAGAQAAPLPVVETLLAGWLLAAAGLSVDQVPMSVAARAASLPLDDGAARGVVLSVPWGCEVALVTAIVAGPDGAPRLVTWRPLSGEVTGRSADLADQPRADLRLDGARATIQEISPGAQDAFLRRAAVLRAASMAGAMDAIMRLTNRYTADRVQFGKPLAAFQAVQQHLVTIAQAAAVTRLNVARAARAVDAAGGAFEAAAVKHLANEHATLCIRAAYQAHGAIGLTREYPLNRFTRRLLVWRGEDGTDQTLTRQLAAAVAATGDLAALVQGRHHTTTGAR